MGREVWSVETSESKNDSVPARDTSNQRRRQRRHEGEAHPPSFAASQSSFASQRWPVAAQA